MKSADENQIVWDLLEWGNLEALKILGVENAEPMGSRYDDHLNPKPHGDESSVLVV